MAKPVHPETKLKLTKRNAAAVAKYATLAGVKPEKFLNQFLKDYFVNQFEDNYNGNAEAYLGGFMFKDRRKAERLARGCETGSIKAESTPGLKSKLLNHRKANSGSLRRVFTAAKCAGLQANN